MAAARRFTVRGIPVKTTTKSRYVAVAVRPVDVYMDGGVYVKFATIIKRSATVATVRTAARRYGVSRGAFAVVVDTVTGKEI